MDNLINYFKSGTPEQLAVRRNVVVGAAVGTGIIVAAEAFDLTNILYYLLPFGL